MCIRDRLKLINTPEEILAGSALYLDIYVLGLPFMFFYNIATGIFSDVYKRQGQDPAGS